MNNLKLDGREYLLELSKMYPSRCAVNSEIVNLKAILSLPKGTEHFLSDLHGEHEAFMHIRCSASGVIRKKVELLFSDTLTVNECNELVTLIYYPIEKLDQVRDAVDDLGEWYKKILIRLLDVCRLVSSKYTRSKVRKHLKKEAKDYDYIINELLNNDYDIDNKDEYYENIYKNIITIDCADEVIVAVCQVIKSLVIDHIHIVGDIFDRGPRSDIIIDELMKENSLDIQWGNHDVLWMGAAAGSRVCIATVLNNSIAYKNLDVIEMGYGISLRPLLQFADEVYKDSDISIFMPKTNEGGDAFVGDDERLIARMRKAISVIQFKLEGQTILRNHNFNMDDRLLLDKIDFDKGTVLINGKSYTLKDKDFPTIQTETPYELTSEEFKVMAYLKTAFMRSEKLQRHTRFLYEKGEMYTVFNHNLLFHGCIPLDDNGRFLKLSAAEGKCGRELMNYCDRVARQGYFSKEGTKIKIRGKDFLWFLWCGKNSPLCARTKITTFERLLIEDESVWNEPKNYYYRCWNEENIAEYILKEFSLGGVGSHIINGHIPVRQKKGETPIKANGKVIVIDGGFCKAYHHTTGIAGYTLIYNAKGMYISAHELFPGKNDAIKNNVDVLSNTVVFEHFNKTIRVDDTDIGVNIRGKINSLLMLKSAYEEGIIKEKLIS